MRDGLSRAPYLACKVSRVSGEGRQSPFDRIKGKGVRIWRRELIQQLSSGLRRLVNLLRHVRPPGFKWPDFNMVCDPKHRNGSWRLETERRWNGEHSLWREGDGTRGFNLPLDIIGYGMTRELVVIVCHEVPCEKFAGIVEFPVGVGPAENDCGTHKQRHPFSWHTKLVLRRNHYLIFTIEARHVLLCPLIAARSPVERSQRSMRAMFDETCRTWRTAVICDSVPGRSYVPST